MLSPFFGLNTSKRRLLASRRGHRRPSGDYDGNRHHRPYGWASQATDQRHAAAAAWLALS
jgi:hypothetical protein